MTKTWLITGTSSGFGKELAQIVAANVDNNLIATARKMSDLDYLDKYDDSKILKVILDVTDTPKIKDVVKSAYDRFGKIDVLVNNAGLGYFSTIEESDMQQVHYMFDVNVFGLANMTNAVLPIMRKQKNGIIVNLSSALALTTLPTMGLYSATKYAVEGYSDTLRQEVSDLGIQVMNVEPSGARTNWSGRSSKKVKPTINDYQKFSDDINSVPDSVTSAPGDPQKIAQVIYNQVINGKELPKHLPLGQFAFEGGISNLESIVDEIKSRRDLSVSTDD